MTRISAIGFRLTADPDAAVKGLQRVSREATRTGAALGRVSLRTSAEVASTAFDLLRNQVAGLGRDIDIVTGSARRLLTALELAASAGAAAFLVAARNATRTGDEYAKAARNANISAESFQSLLFIFETSGLGAEQLFQSLSRVSNILTRAAQGQQEYVRVLDQLGISLEGILALSPENQFRVLIDGIRGVENATQRAGLASILFEDAGRRLIATLGDSDEAWRAVEARFRSVGGVASTQALNAIEDANDAMLTFVRIAQTQLIEALAGLNTGLGGSAQQYRTFAVAIRRLYDTIIGLGQFLVEHGRQVLFVLTAFAVFNTAAALNRIIFRLVILGSVVSAGTKIWRATAGAVAAAGASFQSVVGRSVAAATGVQALGNSASAAIGRLTGMSFAAVKLRVALFGLLAALGPIAIALQIAAASVS